jgi:hypothetical protein
MGLPFGERERRGAIEARMLSEAARIGKRVRIRPDHRSAPLRG